MGKQNKKKIEAFESSEMRFKQSIANHSNKIKVENSTKQEVPAISEIEPELLTFAINDPDSFKYTLKSSNRDKKVRMLAKFLFQNTKHPKFLNKYGMVRLFRVAVAPRKSPQLFVTANGLCVPQQGVLFTKSI